MNVENDPFSRSTHTYDLGKHFYLGANLYTPNHQISSLIKPTQATSDYYSNSSKQDEGKIGDFDRHRLTCMCRRRCRRVDGGQDSLS